MMISKPGDTILETLEQIPLGIEHFKLALINEFEKPIDYDDLISGKQEITYIISCFLEGYFNIDKQFWLNRERDYRAKLEMLNEFKSILETRIKGLKSRFTYSKDKEVQAIVRELEHIVKTQINAD